MINWVPNKKIDHRYVRELLKKNEESNIFTNYGYNIKLLEKEIQNKLEINDNKSIICICNATAGIHAIVSSINLYLNSNLKWGTQSFTFPPSAQCVLKDAIIYDIDLEGGLNINEINKIDSIDGIIVTNIFGNVVDIEKYENWASNNKKFLIFDNAATPYTFYKNNNSCNFGNASVISFHHTKPIGFGEGGAIIIDKIYEESVRRIINFGIDNNKYIGWSRLGSNYKMSEISAVYILQYFKNLENIVKHHQKLYKIMKKSSINLFPNFSSNIPFLSCFSILDKKYDNKFIKYLLKNNIYCRKYYEPLIYKKIANDIYNKIACIPCTTDITEEKLKEIIKLIENY